MDRLFRALAVSAMGLITCACGDPQAAVGTTGPVTSQLPAHANDPSLMAATPMPNSGISVTAPPGFVSFCTRFANQCQPQSGADAINLAPTSWLLLETVNQHVNRTIKPLDDYRHYGRMEYWNIPTDGLGDCEDYALTKRRDLMAAGLPMGALRLAIALTPRGERHAVLTVTTDRGDLVLDNLTDDVVSWEKSPYQWIERQDPAKVWDWVALGMSPDGDKIAAIASLPLGASR